MSDEIVVASESIRPSTDLTVQEAARDYCDPDGAAEILSPRQESAAAGDEITTLDDFDGGGE